MNRLFKYAIMGIAALSQLSIATSCSDDDDVAAEGTERSFMTMFITDDNRGKGDDYPYNSGLDPAYPHGNTVHLYWFGVNDCAGYHVQMALQKKVAVGKEAWESIQGTSDLLLDTIVGPDVLQLLVPDLQYSMSYRFAIRALDKRDRNVKGDPSSFEHASNWYGHGNGRQWPEYFGVDTQERYATPFVVYADQSKTTETTMHVCLTTNVKEFIKVMEFSDKEALEKLDVFTLDRVKELFPKASEVDEANQEDYSKEIDKVESYFENFNVDPATGEFQYKYLRVVPSPNNPNSTVGEKWKYYEITDADRKRGYIDIDGLTPNSVYVIDVIDPSVKLEIDAKYNTFTTRSDGKPGAPILLKYDEMMSQYANAEIPNNEKNLKRTEVFAQAAEYDAAPISNVLYDFISNTDLAEGQTFYLEGGKTYYLDGNDVTCKGFTLATDPADVAAGKRAKVICGIGKHTDVFTQGTNGEQRQGPYSIFVFGRSPEPGEGGEIYMKKLAFYDIDFDNPTAYNYGDNAAGAGTVAGNYFFNMFSDGMAVTLDSLVIQNCTFKRIVRGFIREQGANYKIWNHVLIKGNQFFDSGYYNQGAGGYPWIAGSGANAASNLYKDFKCIENTFYDSPFPSFFCETAQAGWTSGPWNITFSNNTLVNFNTRASGVIFNMRNLPHNSVFRVENNLFVLTKKPGDQRVLGFWGADIRNTMTLGDGSAAKVYLYFNNNWSTNDNLTNGSIFSASQWSSTSNNFGKLVKEGSGILNGSLEVNVADVSSTELFTSPCPPHVAQTANDRNMHRADALDGTAEQYNVNLYYKNKSNDITKNNAGDPRWNK